LHASTIVYGVLLAVKNQSSAERTALNSSGGKKHCVVSASAAIAISCLRERNNEHYVTFDCDGEVVLAIT